jgi:hypothetical protein
MSDGSSRKKKGVKGEVKGGDVRGSVGEKEEETFQQTAFTGARIKVVNQFAALSEDFESIEVERPLPQGRARGQNGGGAKRRAEKFIRADYTYEYDFEESPGSKSSAKGHKKQTSLVRSDLSGLMDTLTSEKLEAAMSRVVGDANATTRFQMLVEALEQHLLRARPLVYNTNEEEWMSFNAPIGEASEEVVEYIATFVATELQSTEQQTTSAQYLVRRLLENTRNPTNASAGFGLRLAAQVLFRDNAWALIACFPLIKGALPKVSNVHTIPESDLDVILFIGAQLLANRDEDAPYAALAYALEILGYTALQKKNAMCVDFLARAYARYAKTYGEQVDPCHTRLSTSVAERCLLDLSKVPTHNVAPALAPLVPLVTPLKRLLLHMGLLSASEERVFVLFQKTVALRELALCAHTLARYSPATLQPYDQASQRSIKRLVRELAHQLEGRSKLPAPEPELQAPIAAAVEAFHLPLHLDAKPHSPSQKRSKQASVTHAHGPRRRGGFCALLLRLVCFFALLALGTYLWRHHVSPWNKDLFYKLSQPVRAATEPHLAKARHWLQPHLDATLTAVQPHFATARAALQPHLDATLAAVTPHYHAALAAVQPHFDSACTASAPLLKLALDKLFLAWALLSQFLQDAYTLAQPHIAQTLSIGRSYATHLGKKLDTLPPQLAALYATHVAPVIDPHLQTAYQFTRPHLQPICDTVNPYWKLFVAELSNVSALIDKHFNVW